ALQPNQKIEYPHPPANGETVADISAKHCVHCGRKTEHIARREKNFDELLRVPCVHKPKINIHRAIYGSLVPREQPFRLVRMIEEFSSAEFRLAKRFAVENHSYAGAVGGDWNQPEPTIDSTDQDCERAVNSFRAPDTIVVREDR